MEVGLHSSMLTCLHNIHVVVLYCTESTSSNFWVVCLNSIKDTLFIIIADINNVLGCICYHFAQVGWNVIREVIVSIGCSNWVGE